MSRPTLTPGGADLATAARRLVARVPTPRRRTVLWGVVLANVEALYVVSYASIMDRSVLDPFLIAPWVWINVGLWAILRTKPPAASRRRRLQALAAGTGYVLGLLVLAGSLAPGAAFGGNPPTGFGAQLFAPPPGWAPTVFYNGQLLHASIVPAYGVGFLALGYLVYATVLDATRAAGLGLLGASVGCVSCTLPLLIAGVAGATGFSSVVLVDAFTDYRYVIGPTLFVATVAMLYWRPAFDGTCGAD